MRRVFAALLTALVLAGTVSAQAATGRVVKVLPHHLDMKGRHSLSPSLYARDAYQAHLRQRPELRSGLRLDVQWRGRAPSGTTLKLRAELRGTVHGDLPGRATLETDVRVGKGGATTQWAKLNLTGEEYKSLGELTAWRVTLWNGNQLVAEQKSFLW